MYRKFFNLKEKPFNLTPSPRFLHLGESHKEALALLAYGVAERKGFVVLTGEVGSGKSTMVQALLADLDHGTRHVLISNPTLSAGEFLNYLGYKAMGRKAPYTSKAEFLLAFEGFLKGCRRHQSNFLLIIDEAQDLSFEMLEEVRLLSNMETADEKLINIFLIGQPELNDKLSDPRCRPLLQRVGIRYHIPPLGLDDTGAYIHTRLQVAGAENPGAFFSKDVIRTLHRCSGGYPRMINILADNALLLGYARGKKKITAAMIAECSSDLNIKDDQLKSAGPVKEKQHTAPRQPRPFRARRLKWAAVAVTAMVVMVVLLYLSDQDAVARLVAYFPAIEKLLNFQF